jgi:hypothetical protein
VVGDLPLSETPVYRPVRRPDVSAGPVQRFKDLLYELYVAARRPAISRVTDVAQIAAAQFGLARGPSRATVRGILGDGPNLPSEPYAVLVAAVLAQLAGRDPATVADQVRVLWGQAQFENRVLLGRRLGLPIGDCDPYTLGVHRAVGPLPAYVPRAHDAAVAELVTAARAGASGLVALVGVPGSGRTRTAWEAIRDLPQYWRLWRPDEQASAAEVAAAVTRAGPYTVVWLGDADRYLLGDVEGPVAAALHGLLSAAAQAPVLVVLTLWPQRWATLTLAAADGEPDTHPQARELLRCADIPVPDAFTGTAVGALREHEDPRLRAAANGATELGITQFLAGVPELLHRYQSAPSMVRTLVDAAVDARRFGMARSVHRAFLVAAAGPVREDGAGPPVPARTRPRSETFAAAIAHATPVLLTAAPAAGGAQVRYEVPDALAHVLMAQREGLFPAAGFWEAVTRTITDPAVLRTFGAQAQRRGRVGRAGQLYEAAVRCADPAAMVALALLREQTGDRRGADRLALLAADHGTMDALWRLVVRSDHAGQLDRADTLAREAAVRGDTGPLRFLAAGCPGTARAEALYQFAADRGDRAVLGHLAMARLERGDTAGAQGLARAAADAGDTNALQELALAHHRSGETSESENLATLAARRGHVFERQILAEHQRWLGPAQLAASLVRDYADLMDAGIRRRFTRACMTDVPYALQMATRFAARRHTRALRTLALHRYADGHTTGAGRLATLAARYGDPTILSDLAVTMARAGDTAGAIRLAVRAAGHGDATAARKLARQHQRADDDETAAELLRAAIVRGDPDAVFDVARFEHRNGDVQSAELRYRQAAGRGVADAARALAQLLQTRGDTAGAATFAGQTAQCGDTTVLLQVGRACELDGDVTTAALLYRQASDHGDSSAALHLVRLWDRHDPDRASDLAMRAAEDGNTVPLRLLAARRARAGRRDEADGLYWAAVERGDPAALLHLPHLREEDHGDPGRAELLALHTADAGRVRAIADLGRMRELSGDLTGAEMLYLRAARRGHHVDLRGVVRLRLASESPPPDTAAELYEQAADGGDAGAGLVMARIRLAAVDGGTDAVAWCLWAADRGHPEALPELVRTFLHVGDTGAANLVRQYGLTDDGSAATAFLW